MPRDNPVPSNSTGAELQDSANVYDVPRGRVGSSLRIAKDFTKLGGRLIYRPPSPVHKPETLGSPGPTAATTRLEIGKVMHQDLPKSTLQGYQTMEPKTPPLPALTIASRPSLLTLPRDFSDPAQQPEVRVPSHRKRARKKPWSTVWGLALIFGNKGYSQRSRYVITGALQSTTSQWRNATVPIDKNQLRTDKTRIGRRE